MTRTELIAAVAVASLKKQLREEPEGTQRICMLGLDSDVVCAIAMAVNSDTSISDKVLVRVSKHFDPSEKLPDETRSDESITHWRHRRLPPKKRAVLFAANQSELQRNNKSIEKVTRIEADKLRLLYKDWIFAAGLTERYLDQRKRKHLEAALGAANDTHAARTIDFFSDFVLSISDNIILMGMPLQKAVDNALPTLRLPRNAGYFDRIPDAQRAASGSWAKIFRQLHQKIRPFLVRENERGEPMDEQLTRNLDAMGDRLEQPVRETIERFIEDDLSADDWRPSQKSVADLDWRSISEVFLGPSQRARSSLGERTVRFFDDEFDDLLEDNERALLHAPFPKEPSDDLAAFFDHYREHISRDKSLYAGWEKYIFNNPKPYNDFFVGLIETVRKLRDRTKDSDLKSKKLTVRIRRSREKSFWRGKNANVARYFAFRYRGIEQMFEPNVMFDFGKLQEFYFPKTDADLSSSTSSARDARSLKFEVELDPDGAKAKFLFIWEMPPRALASSMADDLVRIANEQGDRVLLPTAEIARQSISAAGGIQRIDLTEINTVRDVLNGNNGTMVAPNKDSGDRGGAFLDKLDVLSSVISPEATAAVRIAFEDFRAGYSEAIRAWVGIEGEGIASKNLLNQTNNFADVLNVLIEQANNDRAREELWTELLCVGVGNVGDGASAAIIFPWHPLRLAEIHIKACHAAKLVKNMLAADEDDIFRADLLFGQKVLELQSNYYPEVCIGFAENEAILLSVADSFLDYSLAEQPGRGGNGQVEDTLDVEPGSAAKAFGSVAEQFLTLLPHERTNFSVVLYNAESKALPSALAAELSGKVQQENELQCDLLLTHSQPKRMREVYQQQNAAIADDVGSVMASEAAKNFLSRLRVGFLDEDAFTDHEDTRAADLVALHDVIARNAEVKWKRAPGERRPDLISHVPHRWSRRRPIGAADTAASVYLTAPVQPWVGQLYLNAIQLLLEGDNGHQGDVIPAREVNFKDSLIAEVFTKAHRIGEWVVNYDELADRRLLSNNGVQVIRHIHDRSVNRNITVSTTAKPRLLQTLIRERLDRIDPDIVSSHGIEAVDMLTEQANLLSGHVVMRAARYGHYANELIGVVLSMEELKSGLGASLPIGWYCLDDFATWFGQKEEQIADIMAIAPRVEGGLPVLKLAFSEAKFVTAREYRRQARKSAKQLEETVLRLGRALDPQQRARIDREHWLHRIGDFMIEGMQPFDQPLFGGWNLHRWSEEVRNDKVPIALAGFSHVFVHDEDDYVDAGGPIPLRGVPHCVQQVFDKPRVAARLRAFVASRLPQSESKDNAPFDRWHGAMLSLPKAQSNSEGAAPDGDLIPSGETKDTESPSPPKGIPTQVTNGGAGSQTSDVPDSTGLAPKDPDQATPKTTTMPSLELVEWMNGSDGDNDVDAREWLEDTVVKLQRALRGYDMTAELIGSRLTPNAALIRLRGSDDLTLPKIERRRQELLTSHAIDVINLFAAPMEIIVMVRRPNRAILRLRDLWRQRELPEASPESNTSLLLGAKEADGELLYLNVGDGFAGLQAHGPHTLIAGETGSGKGVLVQSLLLDICATNCPESAKIKMIDPKAGVDFPWLRRMPHLDGNLITSREEAIVTLEEMVEEMERRNRLLADAGVTKLARYNRKVAPNDRLPRIWVFHDELADWMLIDDYRDAVELNASRLGVKARAAGINLVLITQRPDKDALPMQLRANLTNRLVLKVADKRNSVLVLDEPGAERLLGRGHLAAKLSGEGGVILAQVPYADEDEITELADLIRKGWSRPQFDNQN